MPSRTSLRRFLWLVSLIALLPVVPIACAPSDSASSTDMRVTRHTAPASHPIDPVIVRIRDEGMNRSHVRETLDYLCNVIGPRLTGSPNLWRANEWTRDRLTSWGLVDAHLESWGPFGRGWSLKRFSMQVVEPTAIVLHGYPKAWSPGLDAPIETDVVYLDAKSESDLKKYKGTLRGQIVLIGAPREVEPAFTPQATRMDDDRLAKLAASRPSTNPAAPTTQADQPAPPPGELLVPQRGGRSRPTSGPSSRPAMTPLAAQRFAGRLLAFAADEGAAMVVVPSTQGTGGTFFVAAAMLPNEQPTIPGSSTTGPSTRPRPWNLDAPKNIPQVTLAVEDYNRLVRMIGLGQKLKIAADLRVQFHTDDPMGYNTIAEIPGTDLKDEVVMVGAHMDSWHSGTGATDNGVGCAAAMETVRIIKAAGLKPRRTIRVALWTGEEEGLLGSTAYVKRHFGYVPDPPRGGRSATRPATRLSEGTEPDGGADNPATVPTTQPISGVVKGPDYEKLSAYFNLDNGTGKVRGIYAQANDKAMPIFKQWLTPFHDLDARTVTLVNTGATDHIPFDRIGLPAFQFIQDPIEYMTRTHHSNIDTFERAQIDDLKQASTIMAGFVWQAANAEERFPRKPVTSTRSR
jgi:hypothetical protein